MAELVRNVSDTARWVATYRAEESTRRDALFHDPLADKLAGERGRAIAQRASRHSRWALITRTRVIDEYVRTVLQDGCDRVLNLAAGFDTRPYRLELPKDLLWVEADLPALIAEKEQLLAGEQPRCRLERDAVDLSDPTALNELLARRLAGSQRATVITEGLVLYLEEAVVAGLARALLAQPSVHTWILDFNSPRITAEMIRSMRGLLDSAPFKFAPKSGVGFFEALGWTPREVRSLFHEGARFKRLPLLMRPFALIPPPDPRKLGNERWSGVVRFERA
ncbi:MAG TPA: SAM-dependent methyltransferase [Polyangiaceae bacterium]|nr:SAM-dependent methyltransferase [Polyangiaceae bacterium]